MTGSIMPNVVNENKNGLEQIEIEKNDNDEILDLFEKEVEKDEDEDGKNIDKISNAINPESIFYEKIDENLFNLSEIKENNQNDQKLKIDLIEKERDENNIFMLEILLDTNNCKNKLKEILLKVV